MESQTMNDRPSSHKPLGLLGRDEMNLAEFPITLLTDRVPKDQKEAVYQDEIYDERTSRTLSRKLTIQAGNYGLTTAVDDEIILALIQMTKRRNNFTNRKVEFSRNELIETLGWQRRGESYDRIMLSLRRWTSVYLDYQNAWRDNRTKTWKTAGFHIIDNYEINDSRANGDQLDLIPSFIVWNEVIFESFQAGYLKPLDYDLCVGLSNSTAKRMYRFLDKRFHHKPDWSFGLKEFAHEHIGLSRNYDGPAHLRRKLQPAIEELERVGFLEHLEEDERFCKEGREWSIRFLQKGSVAAIPQQPELPLLTAEPLPCPLISALITRSVTKSTAEELVRQHPAELIEEKLEVFDWLIEREDKRIAKSPAGYLVKSIREDYAKPKGFRSRADREALALKRQAEQERLARQQAEQASAEAAKEQREAEEKTLIEAYWNGLSESEQAELDSASKSSDDPELLSLWQREKSTRNKEVRPTYARLRRHAYIRRLLESSGRLPLPE